MLVLRQIRSPATARGALVAATLLLLPTMVLAQSAQVRVESATGKAEALHRSADQMLERSDIGAWPKAARLLDQAAELRPAGDTMAIVEQALAGEMYHFSGSLSRAQKSLETAADRALGNGRVLASARLYLKAAVVAQERGRTADARTLARSAERLARSPHLTASECDCILGHIVWLPDGRLALH